MGSWGALIKWPIMGIHAVLTQDGKVLSFGTDQNGVQGSTMYHDLWDPVTGQHQLIDHHLHTATDIFCAAAIALPGTNDILIAGGDARPLGSTNTGVADVNLFEGSTGKISPTTEAPMNYARWYGTLVALPNGSVVALGGTDRSGTGVGTPEIFTPGKGWKILTGAADADLGSSALYPRGWVGATGEVYYFANGTGNNGKFDLMALDPAGNGTLRKVMDLPFAPSWEAPAIMYGAGKLLVNDVTTGLWTVDLTQSTPVITKVATLAGERNWSNMAVMADGKVLITGGSVGVNTNDGVNKSAVIWDPATNALTTDTSEVNPRLYHSTSLLLADGSILSLGGGAPGPANYLDGQVYKPSYLFDANGNPATRPVIVDAPDMVKPGQSFTITVDNADAISSLKFIRNGAVTHSLNMDSRSVDVTFEKVNATTLKVSLPDNAALVTAGNWMLFAWNKAGVPSVAPIIAVATNDQIMGADADGELIFNGSFDGIKMIAGRPWQAYDNTQIPGWKNTAQDYIELVQVGGNQAIDIDAGGAIDQLYQDVKTEAGKTYDLKFDVTRIVAGSSQVEVLWNGQLVSAINPTAAGSFKFTVTGTGGNDRLSFREIAAENNSDGAFVDNVSLKAAVVVTPPPPPTGGFTPLTTGNDTYADKAGVEEIDGLAGTDTVVITSLAADIGDYVNAAGSLVLTRGGVDIIETVNVERFQFSDDIYAWDAATKAWSWVSKSSTTPPPPPANETVVQNTAVAQVVRGTAAVDVFRIAGSVENYHEEKTADGGVNVFGTDNVKDTLYGVETLRFDDGDFKLGADGLYALPGHTHPPASVFTPLTIGNDTYVDKAGLEKIDGLAGTDTVVVASKAGDVGDYVNAAGSLVLTVAGADILETVNVERFQFSDDIYAWNAADKTWSWVSKSPTTTTPPASENVVQNTAQAQVVRGTDAVDVFRIAGSVKTYHEEKTADGGVSVYGADGVKDTLYNIETLRFDDGDFKLAADGLYDLPAHTHTPPGGEVLHQNAAGTQYIFGTTAAKDVFVVGDASVDYGWDKTQDGQGFVIWNDAGFDLLYDVDVLRFTNEDQPLVM
jgi:hypothetical protein